MTSAFVRITAISVRCSQSSLISTPRPVRLVTPRVSSRVAMTAPTMPHTNPSLHPSRHPSPPPLYAVAPMMDVTDRHYRALARLISRHATLYTEMVVDRTLIHNPKLRLLELRLPPSPNQHPVILQLGGSEPELMQKAAEYTSLYAFSEININCGCPSPKVAHNGCFGAALMKSPHVVAAIAKNVAQVVDVPVSVKCRLGLDWDTSFEPLKDFVHTVHEQGGVQHFIIHARNAVLGGLSPAQNRNVPPLRYDVVYRLVEEFPHIQFSINGGIRTIDDVLSHLQKGIYGVMVGRAAMDAPWQALSEVDSRVYGQENRQEAEDGDGGCITTRRHVLRDYVEYGVNEIKETGCTVRAVIKPILNLFYGERNGKQWRRAIDQGLLRQQSLQDIIDEAVKVIPEQVLDALPGQKVVFAPQSSGDERCTDGRVAEERGAELSSVAV